MLDVCLSKNMCITAGIVRQENPIETLVVEHQSLINVHFLYARCMFVRPELIDKCKPVLVPMILQS